MIGAALAPVPSRRRPRFPRAQSTDGSYQPHRPPARPIGNEKKPMLALPYCVPAVPRSMIARAPGTPSTYTHGPTCTTRMCPSRPNRYCADADLSLAWRPPRSAGHRPRQRTPCPELPVGDHAAVHSSVVVLSGRSAQLLVPSHCQQGSLVASRVLNKIQLRASHHTSSSGFYKRFPTLRVH